MTKKQKKTTLIIGSILIGVLLLSAVGYGLTRPDESSNLTQVKPTPPPPPVNLIPQSDRPFVSLAPKTARNELEFLISTLPLKADEVEVTLEYDRNEGVWDAVLKNFFLKSIPYVDTIFLGSKSTGGHVTYHDDVVGGKLTLSFSGSESPYALEVPWRYEDTESSYTQFATQDAKFQAESQKPIKTTKMLVMQSPGLPAPLDGQVLAGPYLIRVAGSEPDADFALQIRLTEASPTATLYGWDGTTWVKLESTLDGKTLTATSPYYQAWVVTAS